jgi:hypothetical protein
MVPSALLVVQTVHFKDYSGLLRFELIASLFVQHRGNRTKRACVQFRANVDIQTVKVFGTAIVVSGSPTHVGIRQRCFGLERMSNRKR